MLTNPESNTVGGTTDQLILPAQNCKFLNVVVNMGSLEEKNVKAS